MSSASMITMDELTPTRVSDTHAGFPPFSIDIQLSKLPAELLVKFDFQSSSCLRKKIRAFRRGVYINIYYYTIFSKNNHCAMRNQIQISRLRYKHMKLIFMIHL